MALATTALTAAMASPGAGAEEGEFIPGSGAVDVRLLRVGPVAGRLAFAPTVGLAIANYTNTVGRAESRYADYGALDTEIPPELKAQTPALIVDSQEEGAAEGRKETSLGLPEGSPIEAGGATQAVKAGEGPFGESSFTLGDFSPVPGVIAMSGGVATSRAAVVDGKLREAVGSVDIGTLRIGPVVLKGLHWDLVQRTGAKEEAGGGFGIEGISIAGQELAPPKADQLAAAFEQVNAALEPLGIRVGLPKVTTDHGIAAVSPLGIELTASQPGAAVGAPLLGAIQPVRDPITSGFIESAPQAAGLVTLADVTLGALTGSGRLSLELGGGTAFTEGEAFDDPFGGGFDLSAGGADLGPVSLGGGTSSLGGGLGGSAGGDGNEPSAGGEDGDGAGTVELAGSRSLAGSTGGAAAAVGLLGLLAVLAVAGADWHRMRHAPRRIAL